ncbi:MAG TPA: ion transporter [Chitinophagaceae bacterium]|jgi:voltage-gated potassium channel|nr:ion transporter [Chitinophagaceae bacterium]
MYRVTKKKVHGLLHPEIVGDKHWDKIINIFIIVLIILNVIAVILETVQELHDQYSDFFYYFDLVSVIIFTVEYVLRVWSSNHEEKYKHSVWGRIKYMFSVGALIDLLAILPFFLHLFFGLGIDLREIRMLRLLRVLRLFRLTAYTDSAHMIVNVFKKRSKELTISFALAIFLIIIASCLIYFAEHQHPENKLKFSSIPATLWWAVVTLTTTGYGDMYPMTVIGKTMAGVIMLTGVAFFAIPAGILSAGFMDEFRKRRIHKTHRCPHCGESIELDDNHHENH